MKVVAGSLDFKAWYPSLKKEIVVPTIRQRLESSPATIKVNEVELARFLFVMMDEDDIEAEGLADVVHTMKNDEDRKPRLTDQEMVGGDDFRAGLKSKLNPPRRKPTEAQRKKMVAIGMSLIIQKVNLKFGLNIINGKTDTQYIKDVSVLFSTFLFLAHGCHFHLLRK